MQIKPTNKRQKQTQSKQEPQNNRLALRQFYVIRNRKAGSGHVFVLSNFIRRRLPAGQKPGTPHFRTGAAAEWGVGASCFDRSKARHGPAVAAPRNAHTFNVSTQRRVFCFRLASWPLPMVVCALGSDGLRRFTCALPRSGAYGSARQRVVLLQSKSQVSKAAARSDYRTREGRSEGIYTYQAIQRQKREY